MSNRERFYHERDLRSRDYGLEKSVFDEPVEIVVGQDAANCLRGQQATLALINMVAAPFTEMSAWKSSVPLLLPSCRRNSSR